MGNVCYHINTRGGIIKKENAMKSKKGAAIISVILVMILSLGSVSYAAEDNKQGPVLSSISMSSNDITAGDTVDFIFEAHDENTGIRSVNMTWTLEGSDGEV